MLLSIGMIVKNEEKYLEQCLTALKPILDNVDSELIIADTGSTDNTVEIAKKFTDNVFHFEWINDFAAARNSTLDKARGEWYMFIDADEIIKDCSDLINFFNSGEYRNYGSATITIRNYNDLTRMDLYNSCNLHRLTALKDGVRFTKAVHEHFNRFINPVKNMEIIADHYGYVIRDGGKLLDFAKKKAARNLELLFKELEDEKAAGKVRGIVYGQITDCYGLLDDCDNAMKYIELGLENCPPESYVRIDLINKKLKLLNKLEKNEEIIELCRWYFSKENLVRKEKLVTDSAVYFSWAAASFVLNEYDEVINKSVLGFDIYRSYVNGKLYTPELNFCAIETTIPLLKDICNMFIVACCNKKKYDIAVREIDLIPIKEFFADTEFMKTHLAVRTELMENTNFNKLPDLYYQLDKPNRAMFITTLIRFIFRTTKHEHFLKKLSLIAKDDERLSDILKIYNSHFIDHLPNPIQLTRFIEKYGTKENETVWLLMMINNYDIAPFVCAEDFDTEESVNAVFGDFVYLNSAMEPFANYMTASLSDNGVGKAAEAFRQAAVISTEKGLNISQLLVNLGRLGKRWMELNPDKTAPESVAFALTIGEIAELHRKKNYEESIARLEALVGDESEPPADSNAAVLRHYLAVVRGDEQKHKEMLEHHNANPAMIELAEQLKDSIRAMMEAWDLNGAEAALNQMAAMMPFDPDIENLRDEITDRKVNYMNYM